jgi:hypothetical protein
MSDRSQLHDAPTPADPPSLQSTILGVLAGGGLFLAIMLMLAGVAIFSGMITRDDAGRLNLGPWLILEIVGGAFTSLLAGATSRRIARGYRAPLVLAVCALTIGLLEATEILRLTAAGGAKAPTWIVLLAPPVTALGVLLGGWNLGTSFIRLRKGNGALHLTESLRYSLPAVVLAAAAAVSLFVLPRLAAGAESIVVASALTLDFTVVVPGLAFALLVRTRRAPWIILIPTFVVGYAVAMTTIPPQHHFLLEMIRLLVVPAELCVIVYLVVLTRRTFASAAGSEGDFATRFRFAARKVLASRIPADIITTELSLFYYALDLRRPSPAKTGSYTMHRQVGYLTVMVGLIMVLFAETVPVHLIVSRWSSLAAWILTALSIYALIWLVGDYRAMVARPLRVTPTHLALHVGVRWEADIPLALIAQVDLLNRKSEPPKDNTLFAGLLGQSNLRLKLHDSIEVIGMYGLRKTVREIWLTVDDAEKLRKELRGAVADGNRSKVK